MASGRYISYIRVSTKRQGQSGLGLAAQRESVTNYLNGGRWKLLAECVEVESGKNNERPELARALSLCRLHRATLIVAKLDRLARNVAFVSRLMESGVDFVAVDFPQANKLTVHILAAVAEHEANCISQRTKDALAAAKRKGVKLGGDRGNLTPAIMRRGGKASGAVRSAMAAARRDDLAPIVMDIQTNGAKSLRAMAAELNARGFTAPRGGPWQVSSVAQLLRTA